MKQDQLKQKIFSKPSQEVDFDASIKSNLSSEDRYFNPPHMSRNGRRLNLLSNGDSQLHFSSALMLALAVAVIVVSI